METKKSSRKSVLYIRGATASTQPQRCFNNTSQSAVTRQTHPYLSTCPWPSPHLLLVPAISGAGNWIYGVYTIFKWCRLSLTINCDAAAATAVTANSKHRHTQTIFSKATKEGFCRDARGGNGDDRLNEEEWAFNNKFFVFFCSLVFVVVL